MTYDWDEIEQGVRSAGFMAPECEVFRSYFRQRFSEWFNAAERLNRLGHGQYAEAIGLIAGLPPSDPVARGIQMFPRCLSNFQAAVLLAERGLGIEAQFHVRAAYETTFWIGYLAAEPAKALSQLESRNRQSRRRYMQQIVAGGGFITDAIKAKARLQLKEMGPEKDEPRHLELAKIALRGGCGDSYLYYNDLSDSAAHVSLASIFGYLSKDDTGAFDGHQIGPDEDAVAKALALGCHSMIDATSAFSRLAGPPAHRGELAAIEKQMMELDQATRS